MEIGPRSYRMTQWTGCLLALSALMGIALALLASYWPVQVYLLLFLSASAMSLFWTLARSGSKKLAQSLTASESASVEEITRQGKLFRLRFREYNLLWAMIGCASGFLMLHAIGPYASYALIVMAACLTCAAWALIGAILGGRDQTLGVCWRAAFPATPGRIREYVSYAGAVMVLRHRREHARDFDRRSGGVSQLWMTAAYELAGAGREVPVLRFWDRKWENPRRESVARAAVMGGIFLACLLLAALVVPLLQGQAALPPLRNLVSHLLRVPSSLLGQPGNGNQSSKGKSGSQGNSGLNGKGQPGDNGQQNSGGQSGQSGADGQQGASNSGKSGQNANNGQSAGGNQSGNPGANSNGNPQAGNNGANSGHGEHGDKGPKADQGGGVGGGAQGGNQGDAQQGANGSNSGGTNPGQGAGSGAGAKGANAGANAQQKAGNGGNPGANPAQGAGAGNSAKGGNQSGTPQGAGSGSGGGPSPKGSQNGSQSGQANSSGDGAASQGSQAKGDSKGSSGGATNSEESKESSQGIGHGGPAPTIKSAPIVLPPVPRNPGAVVNIELPSTGPPSPNDKQDESNQPQDSARKDKPAAPKYQPRPPSKPRNGEAAPNEPQQHWPNWMYWLLRK